MVDYTEEDLAKHLKMQQVLAEMRERSGQLDSKPTVTVSFGPPGSSTEIRAELRTDVDPLPVVPASAVRFAEGDDLFAIEHLDREYDQIRAKFMTNADMTTVIVVPDNDKIFVTRAWSWRVRDGVDPALRRSGKLVEASVNDVRMSICPDVGIDTEELEADYYRMALTSGKEATLVARDISVFGAFCRAIPLAFSVRNPHAHPLDVLVRIWGRYV